mmetsp:Transcript_33008/g.38749  ORF Transcript_33008/g.38749 Transcript_33008/m.38749 type:complete len:228 (+) Transcript_33008:381-1064(+)
MSLTHGRIVELVHERKNHHHVTDVLLNVAEHLPAFHHRVLITHGSKILQNALILIIQRFSVHDIPEFGFPVSVYVTDIGFEVPHSLQCTQLFASRFRFIIVNNRQIIQCFGGIKFGGTSFHFNECDAEVIQLIICLLDFALESKRAVSSEISTKLTNFLPKDFSFFFDFVLLCFLKIENFFFLSERARHQIFPRHGGIFQDIVHLFIVDLDLVHLHAMLLQHGDRLA